MRVTDPFSKLRSLILATVLFSVSTVAAAGEPKVPSSSEDIRKVVVGLEELMGKAREKKDVIFLNCVNEKLTVVKGLLKIANESEKELGSSDPDAAAHAKAKLKIIFDKVGLLRQEAAECPQEDIPPDTPRTMIQVERSENAPVNDPLLRRYKVRFRVGMSEVTGGRACLGIGLHNGLGSSDVLTRVMLAADGKKAFEQVSDSGVLGPRSGRMLFRKWVEPDSHSVSVRLRIYGKRGKENLVLTATSGMNVNIEAGKCALVEIISTLDGSPEPEPLKMDPPPGKN